MTAPAYIFLRLVPNSTPALQVEVLRNKENRRRFGVGGSGLAHDGRWKRQNDDVCSSLIRAPGGGSANLSCDSEVLFGGEFLPLARSCFFTLSPETQYADDVLPVCVLPSSIPFVIDRGLVHDEVEAPKC